ncbi:MAG: Ig-like domain-containing protein, partial [Candidatus Uhrbacteria bacterium]|nr:Ig-like domain-containing protein [Candidatus Uhrbacteria bacterium]
SSVYGPTVTISTDPADARIGNGRRLTLRAVADDADGVARIDVYVNGGRVKSCPGNACEYTQTYWTNGATSRKVEMYAHAIDKQGYANESQKINLLVDVNSGASGALVGTTGAEPILPDRVPAGQVWNNDRLSGIRWATWTEPNQTLLATGGKMVYAVAANDADGLSKIDVWVNGTVARTCLLGGSKATNLCAVILVGSDYPYGTEVFMNANVQDAKGKNAWTAGTRVRRDTSAVSIASASSPEQAFVTPVGPVFRSTVTVDPNVSEIVRGGIVKVHSQSQNNILGLARVELYLNGSVLSACTFGAVVDTAICNATIDTSTYVQGSTLTIMARAIDGAGHEIWSNVKSVTVRTSTSVVAASASNGMSVWSWLAPQVAELSEGQTADYSVGSWSPKGIVKIEMLVDGVVRRTCLPTTLTGNKECTYTILTYDYSQGHMASVNARITDASGQVMWSEPRFITIKRSWEPINQPGPYVSVTNDHPNGYAYGDKIQLVGHGWSPVGVDRLDIFVNGSKVASCASDACSYTSAAYFKSSFEYAVRLVDAHGQEVWTATLGVNKK